jgi:hypothetical protein
VLREMHYQIWYREHGGRSSGWSDRDFERKKVYLTSKS